MPSSSRRSLRLATFDELRAYLARLADADAGTTGAWGVGQILYHLAGAFEATCDSPASHGSRRRRLSKLPQRLFVLLVGFPRNVPIPAPIAERLRPPAEVDEAEQLARLGRAIDAFEAKAAAFPAHPVFGPLTRKEWRRVHLRHCELHLGHIEIREP
ncbi:MAG: DUF1569 domain-containing protein [Planctomycetes bacterium]|nr:DUF1569 domain-containing protein [Planctomycetota bacterium]